jgi:hypothetical protein
VPDAPGLDEARVEGHIYLPGSASQQQDDLLLDDELEDVCSDSPGETAYDRPWVAFLVSVYEAEASESFVDVEDPGELTEASYALQSHDK